ncbi:protein of unknown function [Candidatus Methylomirabilis oxygeniifera]|uniref:Uncharacterized protein n=1 Tax=Methylomirabilis oxygeniifera TaxID=671143 RepID=D5MMS8_METO1|nr:protein of unknown function [Candidatus Methylomirabilis oxyfera]
MQYSAFDAHKHDAPESVGIYSLVFGADESDPSPLIEKLHHK